MIGNRKKHQRATAHASELLTFSLPWRVRNGSQSHYLQSVGINIALQQRIAELGLTRTELAHRINAAIEELTGRYGTVSEKTIYGMVSGKTKWPHARQRLALAAVFSCSVEDLGFQPPSPTTTHPAPPSEQPLQRRAFVTSAAASVTAAAVPLLAAPSVGNSDIARLRAGLDSLVSIDDQHGGNAALERSAIAGATRAIELQRRPASDRTHQRLYSLAADFTAVAAFSCIDTFALDRAKQHLDQAATLAGLSQDPVIQLRVWNFISMLAHHRGRPRDAVAAARAAQATTAARNDPFLASLTHARIAIGYADQRDRQAALRGIGKAADALSRATEKPRPSWTSFYGLAEIRSLAAVVHDQLGEHERTEAATHQALTMIAPHFRRNRAQTTVRLAKAQLGQGDIEQACSSAHRVIDLMAGDPLTGRMRTQLGDFHRALLAAAPNTSVTQDWTDRARHEWSRRS